MEEKIRTFLSTLTKPQNDLIERKSIRNWSRDIDELVGTFFTKPPLLSDQDLTTCLNQFSLICSYIGKFEDAERLIKTAIDFWS